MGATPAVAPIFYFAQAKSISKRMNGETPKR